MAQKPLFPHMVVGNIVKVPTDTVNNFLINYEVESSDFVSDLVTAHESEEPLTTFETIATDYIENNGDAISDKPDLITLFPQFDALIEMLTTDDPTTIQNPGSEVFDIIAQESILWDNAIAHFIANKTTALTNDLVLAVKLVGLLKKIDDGTLNTKPKILNFWKKSHVVFPKPPFPLPKKAVEEPTPPIAVPDNKYEELLAELQELQAAREDLTATYEFQIQKLKKVKLGGDKYKTGLKLSIDEDQLRNNNLKNNVEINLDEAFEEYTNQPFSDELTIDFFNQLKTETKDVLKDTGIVGNEINVPFTTKKIDERIGRISVLLAQFAQPEQIVLIGNTLIAVNNAVYEDIICTPKGTVSHCELLHQLIAKNPEKTYV